MRPKWFTWNGAKATAEAVREWQEDEAPGDVDRSLLEIQRRVRAEGDVAVREFTQRFDATDVALESLTLRADLDQISSALAELNDDLRHSLKLAAVNIRTVAEAQLTTASPAVALPQGQTVTVREVPVGSAGLYAPGGDAAYPSSVLMCAIPAQVAGVKRLALVSPPGPDGSVNPLVLAAAALCGIDEVYAMNGPAGIFALAHGTPTVGRVDLIAGPGNAWVQEAKRQSFGFVGVDSYAGPSELMAVPSPASDPSWVALDLCAQAEHGEGPLLLAATNEALLKGILRALEEVGERPGVSESPLALVCAPDADAVIDLANAYAPEHLELIDEEAAALAGRVTTAGCIFTGPYGATAFGDYVAGSNHVLPTTGAGRFSGPLGPGTFRRKIATVEVSAEAAAKLAPHVDRIARAEGFPVHGESAMIRTEP
jgi:histidinol dehydrogenase